MKRIFIWYLSSKEMFMKREQVLKEMFQFLCVEIPPSVQEEENLTYVGDPD